MKDKNLDELFREKLRNYEQEPPAYLLENILAGAAGAHRKRKIVLWRVAGVAAAVLLAFVAGWQVNYMNKEVVKQQVVVMRNSYPDAKKPITVVPETNIQDKQVAPNEISGNTKSDEILPVGGRISFQEQKSTDKAILIVRTQEISFLHPIKILKGKLTGNNQSANALHKMKVRSSAIDQSELTIDQQIVEQNKQQLLSENESEKKTRWMVGAQVSPAYSVSRSTHSQAYTNNMLSSSANPVDLGGGISVEYKKGKRWSLQSGVYYTGMGQASGNSGMSNRNLSASADFSSNKGNEYFNAPVNIDAKSSKMSMNSTAGVIEFSGVPNGLVLATNIEEKVLSSSAVVVSDARFIQNFEYIEIPLYLRYTILDSRFDVEMLGGFSSNVLVGNETYMESTSGKSLVGKTKDMETLNYSGTLGVGLKYGLSKRIFLNVEPRVKYYLNSLNNNSSVTYKPYTIGVFTGLSYEF